MSTKAEALDAHTVRYTFKGDLTRDLPLVIAELPILSKAYYADAPVRSDDARAAARLRALRDRRLQAGHLRHLQAPRRTIGPRTCPSIAGRFNFDELRYEYYRDRTVELESLKAGDVDLREEFTSLDWATAYDIARRQGRPAHPRSRCPTSAPPARRASSSTRGASKFKDIRVRKALDLAFDFEWTNKNLFYGLYTRTQSYFENSDMKATGQAEPGRADAARAVPRQAAARGVRRALRAAGDGRLGPQPRQPARGQASC